MGIQVALMVPPALSLFRTKWSGHLVYPRITVAATFSTPAGALEGRLSFHKANKFYKMASLSLAAGVRRPTTAGRCTRLCEGHLDRLGSFWSARTSVPVLDVTVYVTPLRGAAIVLG